MTGETGFLAVPRTWSDPKVPTPDKEKTEVRDRPTKGASLALMYDLLQADSQDDPEDNDAAAGQSAS